jgi:hypothetical protein
LHQAISILKKKSSYPLSKVMGGKRKATRMQTAAKPFIRFDTILHIKLLTNNFCHKPVAERGKLMISKGVDGTA